MGVLKEFYGDPPAGYLVLQTRMPGGGFERMDILVPARLKDQLEEEQLLREIRYEVEDQARRNARSKVVEEARRVEELALLGNDMDEDDNKKASRVKDLSLGMEINARHILWIATANDPALIEPSLRSRFREFWVNHPQGEAALVMAESISREIHAELNLDDMALPTKRITTAIAHLTAREQVSALKQAFAAAVADGREEIGLGDLPAEVRHEIDQLEQTGKKDGPGSPGSGWLH